MYAWPIGNKIYYTWTRDSLTWKPFNHSCDPSCYFKGVLSFYARRDLKKGEEVTIDYTTFLPNHPEF